MNVVKSYELLLTPPLPDSLHFAFYDLEGQQATPHSDDVTEVGEFRFPLYIHSETI